MHKILSTEHTASLVWSKMALRITDLPDELLMNIISLLDLPSDCYDSTHGWSKGDVRPTLCALAVTCRKLSTLAREFMLRDVKLATGWVSSISPLYNADRLRQFARTCHERPDSINYIKTLDMQMDFSAPPGWGLSKDDKAPNLVLRTVSHSDSLSHLRLLLPGVGSTRLLQSLFPHYHSGTLFAGLHSLYLDCGSQSIPPVLFLYLCGLPSLKHIETPSPVGNSPLLKFILSLKEQLPLFPSLNNLRIETINANIMCADLEMERMPKLQELHTTVPGPGVVLDDRDGDYSKYPADHLLSRFEFSPLQKQRWLSPVASTLRSLSMIDPRAVIDAHDGSLLDLSNFEQLEHLKLSIHFLCQLSLHDASRVPQPDLIPVVPERDFYRLLPPSVRTLEIHYDSYQGIFYDPHHLYTVYHVENKSEDHLFAVRNVPRDQILRMMYNELWTDRINSMDVDHGVQSRLAWLLELKHAREKGLYKLIAVTVRETYARDCLWKDFDLVAYYPGVFYDEVLKINVILRVPKKWDPPISSTE